MMHLSRGDMEQYLSPIQSTNPGLRLHIEQIHTGGDLMFLRMDSYGGSAIIAGVAC